MHDHSAVAVVLKKKVDSCREGNLCSEGAVSETTAKFWFQRFKYGDLSLGDNAHAGRPSTVNSEAARQARESNPCSSTRQLSNELGIPQSTIVRELHKLGKSFCRDNALKLNLMSKIFFFAGRLKTCHHDGARPSRTTDTTWKIKVLRLCIYTHFHQLPENGNDF